MSSANAFEDDGMSCPRPPGEDPADVWCTTALEHVSRCFAETDD
jgi:hypothetical protein